MGLGERRDRRQLAEQTVEALFKLALEIYNQDPKLAQRYSEMARHVGMKCRVRIPRKWKLLICKKCKTFLLPNSNCRVRIQQRREPHLTITCLSCGNVKRMSLKPRRRLT
ncbi:MAG: ribonuclease P [Candidatus Bathyarchaeia archaeon]